MLGGLDVVLVVVGPVEIDLLAVVGDGVLLPLGVPAFGDEIAVLVVMAEKGIQVVEDACLNGFAAACAGGLTFRDRYFLPSGVP
jgi:hypothetical protein